MEAAAAREIHSLNADIESFGLRGALTGRCDFTETSRRLGLLARATSSTGNMYKAYRCAMSLSNTWSDRDLWESAARVEKRKYEDAVSSKAGLTPHQ